MSSPLVYPSRPSHVRVWIDNSFRVADFEGYSRDKRKVKVRLFLGGGRKSGVKTVNIENAQEIPA